MNERAPATASWPASDASSSPCHQLICHASAASSLFDQRLAKRILQALKQSPPQDVEEPFSRVLVYETIQPSEDDREEDRADDDLGPGRPTGVAIEADALRLAVLYAASPEHEVVWSEQLARQGDRFVTQLRDYADQHMRRRHIEADDPCLEEDGRARTLQIDTTDQLRRRLDHWCAVGRERVTADIERLDMQRAVHDVMRLLTRIKDFEQRAISSHGELQPLDRDAIAVALAMLARLLAPLAPTVAAEIWSSAGHTPTEHIASWSAAPVPPSHATATRSRDNPSSTA